MLAMHWAAGVLQGSCPMPVLAALADRARILSFSPPRGGKGRQRRPMSFRPQVRIDHAAEVADPILRDLRATFRKVEPHTDEPGTLDQGCLAVLPPPRAFGASQPDHIEGIVAQQNGGRAVIVFAAAADGHLGSVCFARAETPPAASPYFLRRWHSLNAFSHAIRFRV